MNKEELEFLFEYKTESGGYFHVTVREVNLNMALSKFAKVYHDLEEILSVKCITSKNHSQ